MDILSALRKVTVSIKTWADSKLETKLDKNLGTDNAGKVLTISDDGNIESQILDTGIIVLSGTDDNPINIDEIKASGTYLIKGVVTTSMDTTSGSDSAKLNKTFIDGFARRELMSIYSLQDGFVNQLMMNPTRPLVRLDSGEGYSDAIDASYIQPVEKTTEMTQPVGIRSDGQLFTEPFNQVQSDWNENDETNLAYVKNRTHYDSREKFEIFSSGENVDCSGLIKISDEVTTLDKLEMSRIEMSLSVNSINFNNAIFDYDGFIHPLGAFYYNEDLGKELVIIVYSTNANGSTPGTYLGIDENGTGTYSMKLYGEVGELKTLDPKYIKDMYYSGTDDTLLDGTLDFVEDSGLYFYDQESSFILEEGKTYTVVFDGTSYSCTGYIPSSGLPAVLGNASLSGMSGGNNEPFLVTAGVQGDHKVVQIVTNLTGTSHTVKIIGLGKVKKLDKKYLPDEVIDGIDNVKTSKMDANNPVGTGSFSMGRKPDTVVGSNSHAEGSNTTASGSNSHAEGNYTTASGTNSHAEGGHTTASSNYQHVQGKYNIEDSSNTYADIIGNGTEDTARSNAATVDWSGNAWYAGDVYVGSTSGTNKDVGSKKLATEEYVNSVVSEIPSGGGGDIPEALPNPYALTFTGAVTRSYDGSEAVSVEIPGDGYIKPDFGIPKSDLSNEVQTSLSKADTALQEHQDISGKQDVITDLEAIRSGAAKGETALQSVPEEYAKKSDIPIIPTKISSFENDRGYLTEHQDISGKQDVITETNKLSYSLLSDTPTIPASASDIGIIEYTAAEIDELWDSI